ncbi:ABC transporter permease [Aestuariivirga sp.]|uniref:ABC transporter permease n=1 Tax=Aestuariivirga sp. TaxID=2650926 RepID=UPI003BAB77AB
MAAKLKPGQSPLDYGSRPWLKILFTVIFFLLYAPIITLVAFSFNTDKRGVIWRGFTLDNYVKAWHNASLIEALTNSLVIALIATVFATVLGALTALLMWRFRFPFRGAYEGFMALPIVIPEICMGVALLLFFASSGLMEFFVHMPWPLNLSNIVFAHVSFCFPFVAVVVRSRLVGFNRQLEEASKDLGASEWQTFWSIIVPFMKPGLIAGALLAFTLSLDDFVITFFTSGPETVTFPVKVYSLVRRGVSPEINAASTVLIVITVIATILAMKLQAPPKADKG